MRLFVSLEICFLIIEMLIKPNSHIVLLLLFFFVAENTKFQKDSNKTKHTRLNGNTMYLCIYMYVPFILTFIQTFILTFVHSNILFVKLKNCLAFKYQINSCCHINWVLKTQWERIRFFFSIFQCLNKISWNPFWL